MGTRIAGLPGRQALVGLWLLVTGGALLGGVLFACWWEMRYHPQGVERFVLWAGSLSGGTTLLLIGWVLERRLLIPLRHLHGQLARLAANPDGTAATQPSGWLQSLGPDLERIHACWRDDRQALKDARAQGARDISRILEHFEALIQALHAPVLLCDQHCRLLLFNHAAEMLLNGHPGIGLGKPVQALLPDPSLEALLSTLPEDGSRHTLEIELEGRTVRVEACRVRQHQTLLTLSSDIATDDRPQGARHKPDLTIPPRPEFHDFAIADLPPPDSDLGQCPLPALNIVAFDTETTGLDLRHGDRMISLGACRIVNGRVRHDETFDRRINPGRAIPAASTAIHGLTDSDVANQPGANEILPIFHAFVGQAVLLAHNASFDLLAIRQEHSGLTFDMPVLDTLLLSRALDPGLEGHGLDRLAERYGLGFAEGDRHTALGDARVTAQLWLALLPRLEARGIRCLADALMFQQSVYHRDDAYAP